MPTRDRLAYLFQRYLQRVETEEELNELLDLIENDQNKDAVEQLIDAARENRSQKETLNPEQTERLFRAIETKTKKKRIKLWPRLAAAASVLAVVSLLLLKTSNNPAPVATTTKPAVIHDVEAPKTNKATITLADGRTISIDSLSVLTQNNVQLLRTENGQLIYKGAATEISYNTLTNPRGSQVIDITLADGSRVWLNAESSITYPVAFVGNERKVTISGEAYFEVAHQQTPFKVVKGNMEVKVLGTHFNVNAYDSEPDIKVTLLEGKVMVQANGSAILKPGEQVSISHTSQLSQPIPVQTEEVMAWKNGRFEFNETKIQSVMGQIERWYDVEVVFKDAITQHFNGAIPRQASVSKVLNMLEKTGGVRFAIEGKKVLVQKY